MEANPALLHNTNGRQGRAWRCAGCVRRTGPSPKRTGNAGSPVTDRRGRDGCPRLGGLVRGWPALPWLLKLVSFQRIAIFLEKSVDGVFTKMLIRKKMSGETRQFHLISDKKSLSANFQDAGKEKNKFSKYVLTV